MKHLPHGLIDQCGWKGHRKGDAEIMRSVEDKFWGVVRAWASGDWLIINLMGQNEC